MTFSYIRIETKMNILNKSIRNDKFLTGPEERSASFITRMSKGLGPVDNGLTN